VHFGLKSPREDHIREDHVTQTGGSGGGRYSHSTLSPASAPASQGTSSPASASTSESTSSPAGSSTSQDASSPAYAAASSAASYCATPRGNCHLADPQMVGDECRCVTPSGQYVDGIALYAQ
jgi:hypothetical protein